MPSVIPGYTYDIFISYRQNDNRSGWVNDFVKALQEELAATIKDPVSVYFDTNPHDGLLETHNVDKSLEGKLKCLIFIPIISQTYCDPNGFAWQNEFLAFNKMSKEDPFGRDVKLGNGNVTSRILPIRIHDLDPEDKSVLERELGGPLRAVEFGYREAGVNRPLMPTDSKTDNQNKTDYRNQVNKVANAVKDLLQSLKPRLSGVPPIKERPTIVNERSNSKQKVSLGVLLVAILAVAGYFLYPVMQGQRGTPSLRKSMAVLPFVDLSPEKDQEWFSDGLTEELLNSLAQLPELDLIARTSSFAFKDRNIPVSKIADSLDVDYVVEGSVRKIGNQLRITAQLIQADRGTHIWSNTYDRKLDDVFAIQENISASIANSLNILLDDEKKAKMSTGGTRNVEAYQEYLKGFALFETAHRTGPLDTLLFRANGHFERAIALDPNFAAPYSRHPDFINHYFVHDIDLRKFIRVTTDENLYQQIMNDLDAAIRLERDSVRRLAYVAERVVHSSDWSQFPGMVAKFKHLRKPGKPVFTGGFYLGLIAMTEPEPLIEILSDQLRMDPLNTASSDYVAFALLNLNMMDSAKRVIDRYNNTLFSWIYYFRTGDYAKCFEHFQQSSPENAFHSFQVLTTLLAGKYKGSERDLEREIPSMGLNASLVFNALGKYEKADSVAQVYDSRILGPLRMTDLLQFAPLCFRLSATPNFSARLKEAGIDPIQYEKDHYFRFPRVTLK